MIQIVVVVGLILVFLSFIMALINMSKLVDDKTQMERGFKIHLVSMGLMALGVFLCIGGTLSYIFARL